MRAMMPVLAKKVVLAFSCFLMAVLKAELQSFRTDVKSCIPGSKWSSLLWFVVAAI